ncbi:metalloendopeptidase [Desulforapulum autotrophicum HRM2]|uniref:tRNA N6-adenosine threonylcarbamoyltransferase n=1 Tax=Desulforapulum autotrophicum (strain ATCC 43914 / DSM 3382 / VKM B-1955 / HRM2) TaxID=177437 RepID=TSAD_DESAH|nr:tRNA (adenosine(37)-N6)-threonylcarbamoyltransferase complex transferase subunit TsaD [Desulforapulum autotrophicum]C0Q8X7.1 RecName: Full=tRNA N6-adenosine threonylcarbamoyltransferase; AltName: Full=N6-L-threonylcarbamoyladenine synthase; Short=t(6)A synthase; AltName: Full=t(6)A37 threonylcarbamoyladenosine biosynthesis protein TsaD; AltName: Full=tRNA threonylcarbamoyladenosine biosynthesis protein TsaD [Desulforapulum autotrophicum HRM2]ACN14467.1 metalloendopeptidase [Desulforapulum auto
MIILGIESSCDDTAAAVVSDHNTVLSSVVSSQVDVHHRYGGVVPELASRMHIEAISPVVAQAVDQAGISPDQIEGVAVTRGPGLIGALLVGFSFAKAFAWAKNIPWAGVNHLEGHIYSLLLSDDPPAFPFTALLASGGHTSIFHVVSQDRFELLGQTRDDAAGEAFDKVAKMLGLGYPGGAVVEALAAKGDPCLIPFPRSFLDKDGFDFSFSGLKSAVARYVQLNRENLGEMMPHIAAGFQSAVTDVLAFKLIHAARATGCSRIAIAGGVSANRFLASRMKIEAAKHNMALYLPPPSFCGDNAAMIAARGHRLISQGDLCQLDSDVFSRTRFL